MNCKIKCVLALACVLFLVPIFAEALTLDPSDIVQPNSSASGYYIINNTVIMDELIVNSTYAKFVNLTTYNRSVYSLKQNGDFIEHVCENEANCTVPQLSDIRQLRFTGGVNFTVNSYTVSKFSNDGSYIFMLDIYALTPQDATHCNATFNTPSLAPTSAFNISDFTINSSTNTTIEVLVGWGTVGSETSNVTIECAETIEYVNGTLTITAHSPGPGGGGGGSPIDITNVICGDDVCYEGVENKNETAQYCPEDCYIVNVEPRFYNITLANGTGRFLVFHIDNVGKHVDIIPYIEGNYTNVSGFEPTNLSLDMGESVDITLGVFIPIENNQTHFEFNVSFVYNHTTVYVEVREDTFLGWMGRQVSNFQTKSSDLSQMLAYGLVALMVTMVICMLYMVSNKSRKKTKNRGGYLK